MHPNIGNGVRMTRGHQAGIGPILPKQSCHRYPFLSGYDVVTIHRRVKISCPNNCLNWLQKASKRLGTVPFGRTWAKSFFRLVSRDPRFCCRSHTIEINTALESA